MCPFNFSVIGAIAMQTGLDMKIDSDINYLLNMEPRHLFQRGIYLEALFEALDNIEVEDIFAEGFVRIDGDKIVVGGMKFHLEEQGDRYKLIVNINKMIKIKNIVKRAAKFILHFEIGAAERDFIIGQINKIASVLVEEQVDDFKGLDANQIQSILISA